MAKLGTPLHIAAIKADNAWTQELVRLFGKRAGDMRYANAGKGDVGSELRRLHDARMTAQEAWYNDE